MKGLAIVILILGLLVFGCAAPSGGTSAPVSGTVQNGTNTQVTPTVNASGSPQANASVQPVTQGNNSTASSNSTTSSGSDLIGKTYGQLIALGIPLQCGITIITDGKPTKSTVYTDGKGAVRSEVDVTQQGSSCTQMVAIMKGGTAYIGCESGTLFPTTGGASNPFAGCQWMEMATNTSTNTSTTSVTASIGANAPDYTSVPPAQISCVPWVYDPSKFDVSGKSCNIQDIMKQYGGTQSTSG